MRRVCAWCEKVLEGGAAGDPTTHGICLECYPQASGKELVSLPTISAEELDALPYGAIRLDGENRIVAYNAAESRLSHRSPEDVLGKNFFKDVAPCTNVAELAGWLQSARKARETRQTRLEFVFDFPFGREMVDVALMHEAGTGTAHVLVRSAAREVEHA